MKFLSIFLALTISSSLFAVEDKGTNFFQTITSNFKTQSSIINDFSSYGKNVLISGRCFTANSNEANGSALLISNRIVNGGPLGDGSDVVTYGARLHVTKFANYFDNYNYTQYVATYNIQDSSFSVINQVEDKNSNYLQNMFLRKSNSDGFIYGLVFGIDDTVEKACYFYQNNH